MVHVLPSSSLELSLTPGSAFLSHKKNSLTKKHILSFSTSVRLFSKFRIGYGVQTRLQNHSVSATETDDVAVEDVLETPTEESSSDNSKRPRAVRKSEMPPVTNEELISGATFTGKVKSIQPFGAFVDFGAFTDGLVHVSQLSDSFIKDVNSVVSIGQEVSVKIVEANMETKRISLTMRTSDDITSDGSRVSRSNQRSGEGKKFSKFVKGQEFQGTVKNLTRSGAFISLPEGEEGFLPTSEEADGGLGSMMGNTSLQIGEEVKVRVLRMNRGKVTLTMKNEEDGAGADLLTSHGVVHSATNPFVLAFKK